MKPNKEKKGIRQLLEKEADRFLTIMDMYSGYSGYSEYWFYMKDREIKRLKQEIKNQQIWSQQ